MDSKKYSIEGYQSGTTWIVADGLRLHCGYWTKLTGDKTTKQRGHIERYRFIYDLIDNLNKMDESDYIPYVSLMTHRYEVYEDLILFDDDHYFGTLTLSNYEINGNKWDVTPLPDFFKEDIEKMVERAIECDKND